MPQSLTLEYSPGVSTADAGVEAKGLTLGVLRSSPRSFQAVFLAFFDASVPSDPPAAAQFGFQRLIVDD